MIVQATREECDKALAKVNERFDGNIIYRRCDPISSNRLRLTLTVKQSKGPGGRLSVTYMIFGPAKGSPKHLKSACWHVHGYFFDQLFKINPYAVVQAMGKIITKDHGNWEDSNIGSVMHPVYYSDACECYMR